MSSSITGTPCRPVGGAAAPPPSKKKIMEYFSEIKMQVTRHMKVLTLNRSEIRIYLHIDLVQKLLLHPIIE